MVVPDNLSATHRAWLTRRLAVIQAERALQDARRELAEAEKNLTPNDKEIIF